MSPFARKRAYGLRLYAAASDDAAKPRPSKGGILSPGPGQTQTRGLVGRGANGREGKHKGFHPTTAREERISFLLFEFWHFPGTREVETAAAVKRKVKVKTCDRQTYYTHRGQRERKFSAREGWLRPKSPQKATPPPPPFPSLSQKGFFQISKKEKYYMGSCPLQEEEGEGKCDAGRCCESWRPINRGKRWGDKQSANIAL